MTKISHDAGTTWSNETIVSDTDVSRSGIGPSSVSVNEKGVGILWIDSRGTWDENVFFDWLTFDGFEDNDEDEGGGNEEDEGSPTSETPGFEAIALIAAIGVALIILKKKK